MDKRSFLMCPAPGTVACAQPCLTMASWGGKDERMLCILSASRCFDALSRYFDALSRYFNAPIKATQMRLSKPQLFPHEPAGGAIAEGPPPSVTQTGAETTIAKRGWNKHCYFEIVWGGARHKTRWTKGRRLPTSVQLRVRAGPFHEIVGPPRRAREWRHEAPLVSPSSSTRCY